MKDWPSVFGKIFHGEMCLRVRCAFARKRIEGQGGAQRDTPIRVGLSCLGPVQSRSAQILAQKMRWRRSFNPNVPKR
jgi:hypothetical protein